MESIYDNLDNYDEGNIIAELRSENKDLKSKLDEYAINMNKLQKDFDKLASDFKKLETNYSSLLKTARAEIERKTQIITNLNNEKDIMVLNAIKNGNVQQLRTRNSTNYFKTAKDFVSERKGKKESDDVKNTNKNQRDGRKSEKVSNKWDNPNNLNDELMHTQKDRRKVEERRGKTSETKENEIISREKHTKGHRKSIPVVCAQDYNYSDEEIVYREPHSRDRTEKNYHDKYSKDCYSHKISDSVKSNKRHSDYYETSKETHHSKSSHYYERERPRYRDKYGISSKYRKHSSLEWRHNSPKCSQDIHKIEFSRHNVLESPPPDSHYPYRKREREYRSYEQPHLQDVDQFSHISEKSAIRHNLVNDYGEPSNKRQRTNSYNQPEEELRWFSEAENDPTLFKYTEVLSCKSPDYINSEMSPLLPVKEIMNTAEVPLEDPRIISNKYILKTEADKEILSTVTGRNVKMKLVDKCAWDIYVCKPQALVQKPNECSDTTLKEIHMDIGIPTCNTSMESGEICSPDIAARNDDIQKINSTKPNPKINNIYSDSEYENEIPKVYYNTLSRDTNNKSESDTKEILSKETKTTENTGRKDNCDYVVEKSQISRLVDESKICNNDTKKHDNLNIENESDKHKVDSSTNCKTIESDLELSDDNTENIDILKITKNSEALSDITSNKTIENNIFSESYSKISIDDKCNDEKNVHDNAEYKAKVSTSKKQKDNKTIEATIVAESNGKNNIDGKRIVEENVHDNAEDKAKVSTGKKQKYNKTIETNIVAKSCGKISIDGKCNDEENVHDNAEVKVKVSTGKKQKDKKKSSKHREKHKETLKPDEAAQIDPKTTKPNNEKDKRIESKFSCLFGDSSLITPEDLGLTAVQALSKAQTSAAYLPLFEDAQDATDIKQLAATVTNQAKPEKVSDTKIVSNNVQHSELSSNLGTNESINYKNVIPKTIEMEKDVVKTVIISSGIQPRCNINTLEINVPRADEVVKDTNFIRPVNQETTLKALATSTPHKSLQGKNDLVKISKVTATDSNDQIVSTDNTTDHSDSSTQDSHINTDPPDIRIFVKRRRRIIRKPLA